MAFPRIWNTFALDPADSSAGHDDENAINRYYRFSKAPPSRIVDNNVNGTDSSPVKEYDIEPQYIGSTIYGQKINSWDELQTADKIKLTWKYSKGNGFLNKGGQVALLELKVDTDPWTNEAHRKAMATKNPEEILDNVLVDQVVNLL